MKMRPCFWILLLVPAVVQVLGRLGHWVIRVVSRTLTGWYPSRNISLDGWVSGYTRITHIKKFQVPLNTVSIPSRIRLDGYPENPSMDYPDVSIPVPKSANCNLHGNRNWDPAYNIAYTTTWAWISFPSWLNQYEEVWAKFSEGAFKSGKVDFWKINKYIKIK
jgi:hypothetical protein